MKKYTLYYIMLCAFLPASCFHSKELLEPMEILTANRWVLCGIKEEAVYMKDFEKGTPFLRFETNGSVMIFTGCQFIDGTYTLQGSRLRLNFADFNKLCNSQRTPDFISSLKMSNKFVTKVERLVLTYNNTELASFFPK